MRVKFEELVRGADMRHICECAVNPKAVEDDTVERIEEECRHRVARVRNPRRIANGQTPLFDNPLEQRGLRPGVLFGVATQYAWRASVANGNKLGNAKGTPLGMSPEGVVRPGAMLPVAREDEGEALTPADEQRRLERARHEEAIARLERYKAQEEWNRRAIEAQQEINVLLGEDTAHGGDLATCMCLLAQAH